MEEKITEDNVVLFIIIYFNDKNKYCVIVVVCFGWFVSNTFYLAMLNY